MGGSSSTPKRDEDSKKKKDDEEKKRKDLEEARRLQALIDEEEAAESNAKKALNDQLFAIHEEIVKNLEKQEELKTMFGNEESLEAREELKKKEKELIELYEQLRRIRKDMCEEEWEGITSLLKDMSFEVEDKMIGSETDEGLAQEANRESVELKAKKTSSKSYQDACRSLHDSSLLFGSRIRSIDSQLERTTETMDCDRRLTFVPDLTLLVDDAVQDFGAHLQQFVPDESEPTHANLRYIGLKLVGEMNRLLNEINSRIEQYQTEYDPNSRYSLRRHSIRDHMEKVRTLLSDLNSALRELREYSDRAFAETGQKTAEEGDSQPSDDELDKDQPGPSSA